MSERSHFELSADKNCPVCKGEGVVEHTHYDYGPTVRVRLCKCVRSRVLAARPGGRPATEAEQTTVDTQHTFKTWFVFFDSMLDCKKPFDVRKVDPEREPVRVGDTVRFVETDYIGRASGRTLTCKITYVLEGDNIVLPKGWFVMGWNPVCTGARVEP